MTTGWWSSPEEVEPFLRAGRFRGLNVTIPYKKTVMACCDALSPLPGELAASTPFSAARTGLSTEITRTTTGSATCSRPPGPRCAEKSSGAGVRRSLPYRPCGAGRPGRPGDGEYLPQRPGQL
ncbi:MAG: hypothetical protein ACLUJG_03040 [Lawsonibacter sp.]